MGQTSLIEETHKFAKKLDESLSLEYLEPSCQSMGGPETEIIRTSREGRYGGAERDDQ